MSAIESTLTTFLLKFHDQPIVVAYSGGVDSQVLLHALAQLKSAQKIHNAIQVCHVNHGLSDNADAWQQFAQTQCQLLALPFTCIPVNINKSSNESIEALARDARYQALQNCAPKNALIITGHHLDDQSETFLLALKRGSGLKGLAAMQALSSLAGNDLGHILARPLLTITRAAIVAYANQHSLVWIEDESNQDTNFDRNFLRHQVMPILNERWPSMLSTISRSASHCQEGQLLLDELAQQDYAKHQSADSGGIDKLILAELKLLSRPRFNNLLRYFLSLHQGLMPSSQQLEQVYQQLSAPDDKSPAIKVGKMWLRRFQKHLYLTNDFSDVSKHSLTVTLPKTSQDTSVVILPDCIGQCVFSIGVDGEFSNGKGTNLENNAATLSHGHKTLSVKMPAVGQQVTIAFNHQNPKCLPDYRQQRRPLKKVLQELHIPPWQRQRIAFLYYDQELVAALGYFVCKEYIPAGSCDKLLIKWQ